jgi:hypothetical protein
MIFEMGGFLGLYFGVIVFGYGCAALILVCLVMILNERRHGFGVFQRRLGGTI